MYHQWGAYQKTDTHTFASKKKPEERCGYLSLAYNPLQLEYSLKTHVLWELPRHLPESAARMHSLHSPGEHPCTGRRAICDASEFELAAALATKAANPSNQDRLTNGLGARRVGGAGGGARCGESRSSGNTCGAGGATVPIRGTTVPSGGAPVPRGAAVPSGQFTYYKYL